MIETIPRDNAGAAQARNFLVSQEFKSAFQIALAVVITYGIALSVGWNNPHWAAFAVAFCGLATYGESLHKGLLRIAGTFVAFFVTLALIALFPQDRWLFFGALSVYLAFCTYMMGGTSRWYFWNMAGNSVPMLAFGSGPEAINAFDTVVSRAQMTTLGIVVYSVVSALLWPSSSGDLLEGAVKKLASAQRRLFRGYLAQQSSKADDRDLQGLRTQVVQGAGGLQDLLNGAEIDKLEVWEVRHAWRQCIGLFAELNTGLDRWRHALETLRDIDVERAIPGLPACMEEIDTRFRQIELMLAGSPPTAQPREITLRLDENEVGQLSHFHRAAILIAVNQLQHIGRVTHALVNHVGNIRGFAAEQGVLPGVALPRPKRPFDLDHAASVLRMVSSLWLALLIWIYLPDVPAYSALMAMVTAISMMFLIMPQARIVTLVRPLLLSICFAAVLHIFIMPRLDGFAGLALMLFTVTFAISYLFSKPQQMISRVAGLVMFLLLTSIDTPQVYSFLKIGNIALAIALVLGVLVLTTFFPLSFQPERRFLRMLSRFFRSGEYLVAAGPSSEKSPWFDSMLRTFHLHEVTTIPRKLTPWAGALSRDALDKTSPAQLKAVLASLEILGWHIEQLAAARRRIGSKAAPPDLGDDTQAWRTSIETLFARLSARPDAEDHAALRTALDGLLDRINRRIEELRNSADGRSLAQEAETNAYLLLGAYRGLSEALVAYARLARDVDWPRLAESRF